MKKIFRLFYFFLAVLIVPALCQASTTVLSNASPNHTVISGSEEKVYGTSSSNQITLESGANAELLNFPGQNSIRFQASSNLFTVSRSGSVVTFQGSDGTALKIPATATAQTISFNGEESRVLQIYNNQVMLDDQVVTAMPVYLGNPELSVSPSLRNVDSDSGTATFSISNTGVGIMDWSAEVTSGNDWLSIISGSNGLESGTVICQYEENTTGSPRTAIIQITANGVTNSRVDVSVTQDPITFDDGEDVLPVEVNYYFDSGGVMIDFESCGVTGTFYVSGYSWSFVDCNAYPSAGTKMNLEFVNNTSNDIIVSSTLFDYPTGFAESMDLIGTGYEHVSANSTRYLVHTISSERRINGTTVTISVDGFDDVQTLWEWKSF